MLAPPFQDQPSIEILDPAILQRFLADPGNPVLVSFPRTGSHWLRILMELQFERPSLVRIFFYFGQRDFLCWHTHDHDLTLHRDRVIYLHRDPIDTVYSQLRYLESDPSSSDHVTACGQKYLEHLTKWLAGSAGPKKLILSYRDLAVQPQAVLQQIAVFLGLPWDAKRAQDVVRMVSKQLVRNKTAKDDAQVINSSDGYEQARGRFRLEFGSRIRGQFLSVNPSLASIFEQKQPMA